MQNNLLGMKIRPLSEISVMSKAAILFVFVSVILFVTLVTMSLFPEAVNLFFWCLALFVICGYISWWLNNIDVLRTTKNKWWFGYSVLLSIVTAILTIVEITFAIIMCCSIFNIVGAMKIWELLHPVMANIGNFLLWMFLLAWIIQYVINVVIIVKNDFISQ